jgi:hypothetical protein
VSNSEERVEISLSQSEALVLFEFLSRFSESGRLTVDDQAEERVLWDVCCLLERDLVGPLRVDYSELLRKARDEVRDSTVG